MKSDVGDDFDAEAVSAHYTGLVIGGPLAGQSLSHTSPFCCVVIPPNLTPLTFHEPVPSPDTIRCEHVEYVWNESIVFPDGGKVNFWLPMKVVSGKVSTWRVRHAINQLMQGYMAFCEQERDKDALDD